MLKAQFATMHTSTQFKPESGASVFHDEPVDACSTDLCQLTAEELGAVAGGPEVQVGDGG